MVLLKLTVSDLKLSVEIHGDEDEATRWKETYGALETSLLDDDTDDVPESEMELPEVEVEILTIKNFWKYVNPIIL